jgi:SAM-dependent methyltransferase
MSADIFCIGDIKSENSFSSTPVKLTENSEYWKCRGCGSSFVQNIVSERDSIELYSNNEQNKWAPSNFEKEKTKDLIRNIIPYLKPRLNVLDIGCNTGELLDFVAARGVATYGVEYSRLGVLESRRKKHIIFENLDQVGQPNHFDLIFAFDLIEHLYDVNKFIETCRNLLKVGGRLLILTGDAECFSARLAKNRWWYGTYPEHIVFPSRKFYKTLNFFNLEKLVSMFNSRAYQDGYLFSVNKTMGPKIKSFFKQIAKLAYTGAPPIGKDHVLIVLRKK